MGISVERLAGYIQQGFACAMAGTSAGMRDDELVRRAARNMYEYIPFPVNIAIKMSVGIEGLEHFALRFRDKLLERGISDLAQLDSEQMKALVQTSMASMPGLRKVLAGSDDSVAPRELEIGYLGAEPMATPETPLEGLELLHGDSFDGEAEPMPEMPQIVDWPELAVRDEPQPPYAAHDEDFTPQPESSYLQEPEPEPKFWYLLRGETTYGPYSDAEFLAIAEDGRLDLNDKVWREGFADWMDIGQLPGLLG